jgi:hypothetical protein
VPQGRLRISRDSAWVHLPFVRPRMDSSVPYAIPELTSRATLSRPFGTQLVSGGLKQGLMLTAVIPPVFAGAEIG